MVQGMAKGEEWTAEELEKLKAFYTSDASFEEVIRELPFRSPNAIRLKASRLGLKRPILPQRINQINSLILSGDGILRGYVFRCNECGGLVHVDEADLEESGLVRCGSCGALSHFVF
jgi:hypothetical protein